MMNGKKSYLISFTALFSKKGYEVTFGVEQIINSNNWYHLTAPVNTTYRTLIEDTMKNANKVPHSATGLFGKLTNSDNVTEYDGMEIETAVASIVSYLSDIHRYFNGDTVLSGATERQHTGRKLDNVIDVGIVPIEAGQTTPDSTYLEDIITGQLYDVNILIEEGNRVTMSLTSKTGTLDGAETATTGNSTEAEVAELESYAFRLDSEQGEGRAVLARILHQLLEGEIALFSSATHDPKITQATGTHLSNGIIVSEAFDGLSIDYAEIVHNARQERVEFTERVDKGAKIDKGDLAKTQALADIELSAGAVRLEVTETAFMEGIEEATIDMVYDTQGGSLESAERHVQDGTIHSLNKAETSLVAATERAENAVTRQDGVEHQWTLSETRQELSLLLDTLAETFSDHEGVTLDYTSSEKQNEAYLEKGLTVDTRMDAHHQDYVNVETAMQADNQDSIQADTVFLGGLDETHSGDLIQPVYDGMIEGVLSQGENVRTAVVQESLGYDTRMDTHMTKHTAVFTLQDSFVTDALVRSDSHVKDGIIESTASADGSHRELSVVESTIGCNTMQDGTHERIERVDGTLTVDRPSAGTEEATNFQYGTVSNMYETEQTAREGSRYAATEWGKVEMDYDSYRLESIESAEQVGKRTILYSLNSAETVQNATEERLELSISRMDSDDVIRLTGATNSLRGGDAIDDSLHSAIPLRVYEAEMERATGSTLLGGGNGTIQLVTNSEIYVDGKPLVERVVEAKHGDEYQAVVEEFTDSSKNERMNGEVQSLVTFEQMKAVIAESPEILKAVRLMEIMYGSKAAEFIEAGIDNILRDSSTGEFTAAELPAVTESVIEKMRQAGAGVSVVAHHQEPSQAIRLDEADALQPEEFSAGVIEKEQLGEGQELTGASLYDFNRQADVSAISHAILNANKSMGVLHTIETAGNSTKAEGTAPEWTETAEITGDREVTVARMESAGIDTTKVGTTPETFETADKGMEFEGVHASTETATMDLGKDALLHTTETADQYDGRKVAILPTIEGAVNGTNAEGVLFEIEGATQGMTKEAVLPEIEGAYISDGNKPTMLHGLEGAHISGGSGDSVLHETEYANFSDRGYISSEAKPETATYYEAFDLHMAGIEGATHYNSEEAVLSELEGATQGTSKDGVIHEGETAYIDDSNNIAIINKREEADYGSGQEAVIHESEEADGSGRASEAVIYESEKADSGGRVREAVVQGDTKADKVAKDDLIVIEELEEAVRKRKQLVTEIEDGTDSRNDRKPTITTISGHETARRPMKLVVTSIDEPESAQRPKREIETTIEKPEGGTLTTPSEPKKPRIWLILGKIASWSIWNWKKTR